MWSLELYTCLNSSSSGQKPLYPFLGKWVFASFGDSDFVLCEPSFGIMLVFKPLQGPSVPIKAKDAVPGDATPTRNEVTLLPGSWGWGFRRQSASPLFSPARAQASRKKSAMHISASGDQPRGPGS